MTITIEQMNKSAEIADKMGDNQANSALVSIAKQWIEYGSISSRQVDYASSLVERYSPKVWQARQEKIEEIEKLWRAKDEKYLDWLEFISFFFVAENCRRFEHHIRRLSPSARQVQVFLEAYRTKALIVDHCPCPTKQIIELEGSKLIETLRATFNAEPKYKVGDLVVIRGKSTYFMGWWVTKNWEKRFIRSGFQISIVTEILNGTYRCKQVHKTKGSSRLYRLKAFSGGETSDCIIEESEIKPMK